MIDIHTHILPGIDDGVKNQAEALAAASKALEQGISGLAATPHIISGVYESSRTMIIQEVENLKNLLLSEGIELHIYPGAEYYADNAFFQRLSRGNILTINDTGRYVLLELPFQQVPYHFTKLIFSLRLRGITPILAHPELNWELTADPEKLYNLILRGLLVQITSGSLVGLFGSVAQSSAILFCRQHWVHFMASDLHGPGGRLLQFNKARNYLIKLLGEEDARRILVNNPRLIIEGHPISIPQPIPLKKGWPHLFREWKNLKMLLRKVF